MKPTTTESDSLNEEDTNESQPGRFCREPEDLPTREDLLKEARDFHDEWSRRNPNSVYGQSYL